MKIKRISISIVLLLFFVNSTVFAIENSTSTKTTNSPTTGFVPNSTDIERFNNNGGTGTGSSNANYFPKFLPGPVTNSPFACDADNGNRAATTPDTGMGNGCNDSHDGTGSHSNNPITAPNFDGPNTAVGHVVVKVPVALNDPKLTMNGSINFDLDVSAKLATTDENITQSLSTDDGNQTITLSSIGGAPFATSDSATSFLNMTPNSSRNIPWSIVLDQESPFLGSSSKFHTESSGIFEYKIDAGDITLFNAYQSNAPCANKSFQGAGMSASCWPLNNAFDLPGYGTGQDNFGGNQQ